MKLREKITKMIKEIWRFVFDLNLKIPDQFVKNCNVYKTNNNFTVKNICNKHFKKKKKTTSTFNTK